MFEDLITIIFTRAIQYKFLFIEVFQRYGPERLLFFTGKTGYQIPED
jgi:hypothetical protein